MALLDMLGRRWTLRILWELREEALSFRGLRDRCDNMSPSVLNHRLAELRGADLVRLSEEGYRLTPGGKELGGILMNLHAFAQRWSKRKKKRG